MPKATHRLPAAFSFLLLVSLPVSTDQTGIFSPSDKDHRAVGGIRASLGSDMLNPVYRYGTTEKSEQKSTSVDSTVWHLYASLEEHDDNPDQSQREITETKDRSPDINFLDTENKTNDSTTGTPDEQRKHKEVNVQSSTDEKISYYEELQGLIVQNVTYPERAYRNNIQGTCIVFIKILRTGNLISYELSKSAGSAVLDAECRATIERIGKFPPVSPSTPEKFTEFQVSIPITFDMGRH